MIARLTLLIPVMIISTAALGLGVELKDITFTTKDAGKVVLTMNRRRRDYIAAVWKMASSVRRGNGPEENRDCRLII